MREVAASLAWMKRSKSQARSLGSSCDVQGDFGSKQVHPLIVLELEWVFLSLIRVQNTNCVWVQ